jgi:hypothetical protein
MSNSNTEPRVQRNPLEETGDYAPADQEILPFEARGHERVVPIRPADLDRLIASDPRLAPSERTQWERLCRLLRATFHHEYLAWLNSLKDLYSPVDPDSECVRTMRGALATTEDSDEAFLKPFEAALLRANYRQLELQEVKRAVEAPNERGLNYVPNFELFEHLKVYARGRTRVQRRVRNIRTRFRRKTIELDAFQRLVVAIKFRPAENLGPYVRTDVVYLRLFKDVPFVDMEMHLPEQGTKVRMRTIDKAQIASPLLVGLPAFALKLLQISWLTLMSPMALTGVLVAPLSAGVNSFFGFQRAKQRHLYHMIRNLYYLTLGNNASVLSCIIDSASEEDYKEALLAYFVLWLAGEPLDQATLDARVESLIAEHAGVQVDFEIGDALGKLVRLGIVRRATDDTLEAVGLDSALSILDEQWDDQFRYAANHGGPTEIIDRT